MPGVVPPNNVAAEQATLGSMMIEQGALLRGMELLNASDFYRPVHQTVFEALCAMGARSEPVDIITFSEELRKRGKLDDCGGAEYLDSLVNSVPTAARIEYYANDVRWKSTLRRVISIATEVAQAAYKGEDDVVERFAAKALELTSEREAGDLEKVSDMISDHLSLLNERRSATSERLFGSGIPTLDQVFGKLGEAQYWVIKGRRGSGKTHWGIYECYRCAEFGKRAAAIFSFEMSRHQVIDRLMACFGEVNSRMFRHVRDDEEWAAAIDAAKRLYEPSIYICDARKSVAQMHAACKRLKLQGVDLALVVADYAELIKPPPGRWSREDELGEISDSLGQMSKDLDLTVLLLSQVNKKGEERNSEAIGNRADLLTAWLPDGDDDRRGDLYIEKNRMGAGEMTIRCLMDKKCSRIGEVSDERDPQ